VQLPPIELCTCKKAETETEMNARGEENDERRSMLFRCDGKYISACCRLPTTRPNAKKVKLKRL